MAEKAKIWIGNCPVTSKQSMLELVSGDISWITEFTQELKLVKPLEITFP